jgi:hypothetical protein
MRQSVPLQQGNYFRFRAELSLRFLPFLQLLRRRADSQKN